MSRWRAPVVLSLLALLCLAVAFCMFAWSATSGPHGDLVLSAAVGLTAASPGTALLAVMKERSAVRRFSWFTASVALLSCLAAMLIPLAVGWVHTMRSYFCDKFLQHKVVALQMYEAEYGALPPADRWCDALGPEDGGDSWFMCPERPRLGCGYAFNSALSGGSLDGIRDPEHTVLLFESDRGWNAAGDASLLPPEPRHGGRDMYGMVMAFSPSRSVARTALMDGAAGIVWDPMPKDR